MIKVAFWYDRPLAYSGGLNYMKNLLFALYQLEEKKIQPYIFFGKNVDEETVRPFEAFSIVVRTSILDRKSLSWYAHQIFSRIFGLQFMVNFVLRKHGISIVSHAEHIYGRNCPFRVISWIPDFQYLHHPELFPELDIEAETKRMNMIATQSDALILSSYAALKDYRSIEVPGNLKNVFVLQFVSQPSIDLQNISEPITREMMEIRYGFKGRYFFLPNQFWMHKNHRIVFSAINSLKDRGVEVVLLCTGNLNDYRIHGSTYVDGLLTYIVENDLSQNIKILGLINYAEVLFLMRNSIAVLNPSRFEGWSSTVEESRSMGKRLILSNIPVHLEQNPPNALFFDPDDEKTLVQIMATQWMSSVDTIKFEEEEFAVKDLQQRTIAYAEGYTSIVLALEK